MEEDKTKRNKRNKKKKNKQAAKPTEGVALDAGEPTSNHQNNVLEGREDSNGQVSGATNELDDVGEHKDAYKDGTFANSFEGKNIVTAEEHLRPDSEASFLEKVKVLQAEKEAHAQKEAFLEDNIKQLVKEKDEMFQKEASQKDKIKQLQDEMHAYTKNEVILKEELMQLEKEKNALIQKVISLETKIQHVESEKDLWLLKEAGFEKKIIQIEEEAAALNLKEVNSQEKINQLERERDSWILKEDSVRELIAHLTNDNAQLQAQVIELEQARESLYEERKQLKEVVSSLRLRITNLESSAGLLHSSMDYKLASEDEINHKLEAAELVEKLVAENSELVGKVNELRAELDLRRLRGTEEISSAISVYGALNATPSDDSTLVPELGVEDDDDRHGMAQAMDSISEASKTTPILGSSQSLEDVVVHDKSNAEHVSLNDGYGIGIMTSEIMEGDEIVQIPLDENEEVVTESNSEVSQIDENTDVPLTDAPLIGAPFRLISFVARYVSGADLVNKNAGRS